MGASLVEIYGQDQHAHKAQIIYLMSLRLLYRPCLLECDNDVIVAF